MADQFSAAPFAAQQIVDDAQPYIDRHAQSAQEGLWQPDMRRKAIDRIRLMSVRHARHVWERRFRDPISHHALALLYIHRERPEPSRLVQGQPAEPAPVRYSVHAAWRLWLEGPEVADLSRLLFELHHKLAPKVARPGFDVRAGLPITGQDKDMPSQAIYAGIAAISLDTPDLSWADARRVTADAEDIGSFARIVLAEGTVMTLHRHGYGDYNKLKVCSTHNINFANGFTPHPWTWVTLSQLLPDPEDSRNPLNWLIALGETCAQADNRRIVAQHAGGQR